jgi:predicted oxidoreductase
VPHHDWRQQREAGVAAQVQAFAAALGVTPAQLSLAWLMRLPGTVIPLVGSADPEHVVEAAAAVQVPLDRDDWYELMVIGRGRPMPWGQPPYAYLKDR